MPPNLRYFCADGKSAVSQAPIPADPMVSIPDGISRTASEFELVFKHRTKDGFTDESSAWLTRYVVQGQIPPRYDDRIEISTPSQEPHRVTPVYYLSPHVATSQLWATWYGALQRDGSDADIIDLLKTIEPRVVDIVPISRSNRVDMYAKIGGSRQAFPLALIGQGLNRVFELAVLTRYAQGGILLIDEIENGLHFRSLPAMFERLYELAVRFNVQVFAVTHSDECVEAARVAIGATESRELAYYRLGRENGRVHAHHFDIDKLDRARAAHMEVR